MNEKAQIQAIAEACGVADLWVLMKRGLYYLPNANGYTDRINEAWMLRESEAEKHVCPHDEPVTMHCAPLRDYLHDLNAAMQFADLLCLGSLPFAFALSRSGTDFYVCQFQRYNELFSANSTEPAKAICEGGLKALGKWVDA